MDALQHQHIRLLHLDKIPLVLALARLKIKIRQLHTLSIQKLRHILVQQINIQRLQALKDLGHYAGDLAAPWDAAAIEALKKAQAALGIQVDGKWGPATEDAIQDALQPACTSPDGCAAEGTGADAGPATDALGRLRIVGGVVAGITIAGITAAVAVTMRRRRPASKETAP